MSDDLREQVAVALGADPEYPDTHCELCRAAWDKADAVLAVVRERLARDIAALLVDEKVLGEQILALVRGVGEATP